MSKQIMIVDDSSIMRKMVRNLLEKKGYQIAAEARNGREAIDMYDQHRPELVIMDVTMRDMDGFSAAREIMTLDSGARIVFFSNLDKEQYSGRAAEVGALGFVNKHNLDQLLELI
ncbi:MAG: hypothetical protein CSB24_04880 [Deltaproteobacteria bacterium]|nr:MAG: hypothetical protein CSB24_04880 [Deltaproteobacteria bacterium]